MRAWLGLLAALGLGGAPAYAEGERIHVVQRGESLSEIAVLAVGDPGCWPEIYRANRDQIKDPQVLHPGQRLVIPESLDCTATEPPEELED